MARRSAGDASSPIPGVTQPSVPRPVQFLMHVIVTIDGEDGQDSIASAIRREAREAGVRIHRFHLRQERGRDLAPFALAQLRAGRAERVVCTLLVDDVARLRSRDGDRDRCRRRRAAARAAAVHHARVLAHGAVSAAVLARPTAAAIRAATCCREHGSDLDEPSREPHGGHECKARALEVPSEISRITVCRLAARRDDGIVDRDRSRSRQRSRCRWYTDSPIPGSPPSTVARNSRRSCPSSLSPLLPPAAASHPAARPAASAGRAPTALHCGDSSSSCSAQQRSHRAHRRAARTRHGPGAQGRRAGGCLFQHERHLHDAGGAAHPGQEARPVWLESRRRARDLSGRRVQAGRSAARAHHGSRALDMGAAHLGRQVRALQPRSGRRRELAPLAGRPRRDGRDPISPRATRSTATSRCCHAASRGRWSTPSTWPPRRPRR